METLYRSAELASDDNFYMGWVITPCYVISRYVDNSKRFRSIKALDMFGRALDTQVLAEAYHRLKR